MTDKTRPKKENKNYQTSKTEQEMDRELMKYKKNDSWTKKKNSQPKQCL